jgi:glycosyltransferase involved in cell wall biosynthesis
MSIMAGYWASQAWEVTLLTYDEGTVQPFYPLHQDINCRQLDLAGDSRNPLSACWNNLRRIRKLRAAIRASQPDCVISFIDQTNVLTLLATRGTGIPVVVSERTFPPAHSIGTFWNLLRRLSYIGADRIVTVTERARQSLPQRIRAKSITIPNPVRSPVVLDATRYRESAGRRSILAVGHLARHKGHDLLLRAFALSQGRRAGWDLVILGEGPQRKELELLRDHLALTNCVRMPGRVRNLEDYFQQADLFVMTSRYEGFPLALCEAMASGLPVISTDCPSGPREIIRDGVDGVLVPNEDVDALAAAMDRLISDEEERRRLATRATEITERFSLPKVMAMWEAVLAEVVKG